MNANINIDNNKIKKANKAQKQIFKKKKRVRIELYVHRPRKTPLPF